MEELVEGAQQSALLDMGALEKVIFVFLTTFSPEQLIYFMFQLNFTSNNLDQGSGLWVKDSESSLSFCSSEFIDFHTIPMFLGAFSSTSMHILLS